SKGVAARNAVGPAGLWLAQALLGALGITAYAVPLGGLYLAGVLFVGAQGRKGWPKALAAGMLGVSVSVFAQILAPRRARAAYPRGGALGKELSSMLCGLFSVMGTAILMGAMAIAALILGMQAPFLRLCHRAWHGGQQAAAHFAAWLKLAWD